MSISAVSYLKNLIELLRFAESRLESRSMSNLLHPSLLRRSKPDEQDAALRKLQATSIHRHESEGSESCSSPSFIEELKLNQNFKDTLSLVDTLSPSIAPLVSVSKSPSTSPNLSMAKDRKSLQLLSSSPAKSPLLSPKFTTTQNLMQLPSTRNIGIPASPKLRSKSEADYLEKSHGFPLSTSPTSPARKFFKMFSGQPTVPTQKRRGSEPILDGISATDFQEIQMSVTDRRWEKLRSILTAMKEEPVDIDTILLSSPPVLLEQLQEKITAQEELCAAQKEISSLNDAFDLKKQELAQVTSERNAAFAYIQQMTTQKTDSGQDHKGSEDHVKIQDFYQGGIDHLRTSNATKDDLLEVITTLTEELSTQQNYLRHLMGVVLVRAPWMLEEVDGTGQELDYFHDFDPDVVGNDDIEEEEEDYEALNDSDDEVWC